MTYDALDPGEDWTYPFVPRDAQGFLDEQRMPVGLRTQRAPDGTRHQIDVTPSVRLADGRLVPVTAVVPRRPVAGY